MNILIWADLLLEYGVLCLMQGQGPMLCEEVLHMSGNFGLHDGNDAQPMAHGRLHPPEWDTSGYMGQLQQVGDAKWKQRKTKPRWYEALEQETLIDPTVGSDRTLMKDYRDSPREIDTLRPFCLHSLVPTAPTKNRFGSQPTTLNGKGNIGSSD